MAFTGPIWTGIALSFLTVDEMSRYEFEWKKVDHLGEGVIAGEDISFETPNHYS
jgi:hypothetical protein